MQNEGIERIVVCWDILSAFVACLFHEELLGLFSEYSVIQWRNMKILREEVNEYWLQKKSVFPTARPIL
jgi:hypothetical protein